MMRRSASLLPVLAAVPLIAACSADAVTPPEPEVGRPGSFVAATDDLGVMFLIRTLRVVPIDSRESLLEAIHYQGAPESYEQATAWAKDPEWPVTRRHATFSLRVVLSLEHEVVWFRTLTDNELAALR